MSPWEKHRLIGRGHITWRRANVDTNVLSEKSGIDFNRHMLIQVLLLLSVTRYRCSTLGLPGGGVRPAGEHREVQQPALRQEQKRRLRARGQLPAERAGPARGAAGGLPLQLRDVAGARGVLSAHPVGGAAAEPVTAEAGRRRRRRQGNVALQRSIKSVVFISEVS